MACDHLQSFISRRQFLKATGIAITTASLGTAVLPVGSVLAQGSAKYQRLNVSDPNASHVLNSYKKAIRAMLKLPPTDPRNWYRVALTHTLDCPHGNWWFLPWHRGYIGWFEQICRELSGDPSFALPYWDWTQNLDPTRRPSVPLVMFEDVLTPTNPAYIGKFDQFKTHFKHVVAKANYWKRVSTAKGEFDRATQYGQLLARGIRSPEDLWFDINDDPRGKFFFDLAHARGLTKEKREFDEKTTKAVSLPKLLEALCPIDFLTFGSSKTLSHGALTGFGVLENEPHNKVHNCVGGKFTTSNAGGFMQDNMSPVDPLFFLHHANIDRLWDVWTRKQQAHGYPILPNGYPTKPGAEIPKDSEYDQWSNELFLFFVDSKGEPVSKTTAGHYAMIGDFNYSYQPGSGEQIVPTKVSTPVAAPKSVQFFNAKMVNKSGSATKAANGVATIPAALLQTASEPNAKCVLFATVTLVPSSHAGEYKVVVNGPADAASVGPSSPYYAATLSIFGHRSIQYPVTFTVPLSGPLAAIRSEKLIPAETPLDIRVVPETAAMPYQEIAEKRAHRPMFDQPVKPASAPEGKADGMDARVEVLSIVVEAH